MVVGVDFSDGSAVAVVEARRLAERFGVGLSVAHVTDNGDDTIASRPVAEWLEKLGIEASRVTVLRGVAWVELARHAKEVEAELLVVGSHGVSGFNPMGPGRTATRLSVRSPVPLLVVPAGRPMMAGDVVAGDSSEHEPEGFRRLQGQFRTRRETTW